MITTATYYCCPKAKGDEKLKDYKAENFKALNKQLKKEAIYTCILYLLFFIWWYATAYGLADAPQRVWGLPIWFFLSCIVGWLLCCVGVTVLVKCFFRDVDLDAYNIEEQPQEAVKAGEEQ